MSPSSALRELSPANGFVSLRNGNGSQRYPSGSVQMPLLEACGPAASQFAGDSPDPGFRSEAQRG